MTNLADAPPTHPVQTKRAHDRTPGRVPQTVSLAAYEVYRHVHGTQEAMITGGCRGGFSTGELVALLYARAFTKAEWGARIDEALRGMKGL